MDHLTDFHYDPFDPAHPDQGRQLAGMYEGYLLEEFDRTGKLAPGFPVAFFLQTLLVWDGTKAVGFCSVDPKRCSVELMYITPAYRRKGLALVLLAQLAATCPRPMELKAPLTPGGRALADRLQLGIALPEEDQDLTGLHRAINARCRHRRGNPLNPCRRCYRAGLPKVAARVVGTYVIACRAAATTGIDLRGAMQHAAH
jgi:GNAT superfamily N-acetyltransferase